jgi:hypothetical protein
MSSPEVAWQLCVHKIFLGFCCPNAVLKDLQFIQVMAAPVSNSHELVWIPACTLSLGQILSPRARTSAIKEEHSRKLETRLLRETETIRTLDKVDKWTSGQLDEEDPDPEITQNTMANTATIANSKDIDWKNARKGSEKTNHARMPKDNCSGPKFN